MLLIVFVENAFKHSKNNHDEKIFIDISLATQSGSIVFHVKNSHVRSELTHGPAKKHSGFGLESVRKRLDLLYQNAHELSIRESDKTYAINLILSYK
jgi:sensor histidine kinase YesM